MPAPGGLLAVVVALSVATAAQANGDGFYKTPKNVSIDYSALDAPPPTPSLLLPAPGGADNGPIVLKPPAGVKPAQPSGGKIKLRPPAGAKKPVTVKQAKDTTAPAKTPPTKEAAAPKPKETKTAALTEKIPPVAKTPTTTPATATPPKPATPAVTPAKPAPAATAPAAPPAQKAANAAPSPPPAPTATPPAKAPSAPAAAPAAPTPAPQSTTVASAQPPKSLLTPPPAAPKAEVAKEPEPAAEAKPADKPAEVKMAALPPKAATDDTLTISFPVGTADLPGDATAGVKALAARLAKDPALRVQLVAYASDPDKSISRSRRLSLERAVSVRKLLLSSGVESTRIDLRALGEQSGGGAPDRVDAITTKR